MVLDAWLTVRASEALSGLCARNIPMAVVDVDVHSRVRLSPPCRETHPPGEEDALDWLLRWDLRLGLSHEVVKLLI